jgi:hypothetical protein
VLEVEEEEEDGFFARDTLSEGQRLQLSRMAKGGAGAELAVLKARLWETISASPDDLARLLRGSKGLVDTLIAEMRLGPAKGEELEQNLQALLNQFSDQFLPKAEDDGTGGE